MVESVPDCGRELELDDHWFDLMIFSCTRITFPFAGLCKIIKILVFLMKCLRIFLGRKNRCLSVHLSKSFLKEQTRARVCICCLRKQSYTFEREHQGSVCARVLSQVVYQEIIATDAVNKYTFFQSRKKKPRWKSRLHQNTVILTS